MNVNNAIGQKNIIQKTLLVATIDRFRPRFAQSLRLTTSVLFHRIRIGLLGTFRIILKRELIQPFLLVQSNTFQGKANFLFTLVTDAIRRRLPNNLDKETKRDFTKKSIISVIVDRIVK